MLALTFWKVSPKGKAFTLIRVPFITVAVIVIIIGVAVAVVVVIMAAAVVASGKGSGENPKKFSLQKERRFPLGFLMRNKAYIRVIGAPINISPI